MIAAASEHLRPVFSPKGLTVKANISQVLQPDTSRGLEAQKKQLRQSCREFESVMLSYIMKTMREGTLRAEKQDNAMSMYEDMFFGEVSKKVGHTSALGLGDLLYSKLEPLVKPRASQGTDSAAAGIGDVDSSQEGEDSGAG